MEKYLVKANLSAGAMDSGGGAPSSIEYMPSGVHTINCSVDGKAAPKDRRLKLPEGFKAVEISDVYRRIGGGNSEIVEGSDGKPAKFSKLGINHFKGKKREEKTKRLKSLDVAQDTVRTGKHFESKIPNTNITQTEFIKDYGRKFYYTARRNDTGEVYSWHELSPSQFKRKQEALNEYNANGTIR